MEKQQQPPSPAADGSQTAGKMKKKSKRMPSPQEMVAHYEKQGMATQEASLKVIGDLQGALFRVIAANSKRGGDSSNSNPNTSSPQVISAKLDAVHSQISAPSTSWASAAADSAVDFSSSDIPAPGQQFAQFISSS